VLVLALLVVVGWRAYIWRLDQRRTALFAQCRTAMAEKHWDDLDAIATDWTEWDTENGYAWLFVADAATHKEDYARAAECLGMLADDDPKVVPALMERMRICFEHLNQPLEAVATCERILRIEPRASRAHSRLIFFYAMSLQRGKLMHCTRRAIKARAEPPDAYVYLFGADWLLFSNAMTVCSHWLESHPDVEPFLVAQAILVASMAPGDKKADPFASGILQGGNEALINEYLLRFPDNLEVLAFHLKKHADAGNLERLAELLSRAPVEAENDNRFWRYKGVYHAERGELAEAIEAFNNAVKIHPYDWQARHRLSVVLRLSRRLDEAEQQAQLAAQGKEIERKIKNLTNVDAASPEVLRSIADYARASGDREVAEALGLRL